MKENEIITKDKNVINFLRKKMCLGKDKLKSLLSAQYIFDSFKSHRHKTATLTIYKCPFCKFYHIGNDIKHELAEKQVIKNK